MNWSTQGEARGRVSAAMLVFWLVFWGGVLPLACERGSPPEASIREVRDSGDVKSPKTNVILITLDTVRADALGVYGQPLPTSPRIDQLAREGITFDQCASSTPNTLPSHATIFTGNFPFRHGVRSNYGYRLAEESITLAERLQAAGYRTHAEVAAIVLRRDTQIAQGFDFHRHAESHVVRNKKIVLAEEGGTREVGLSERDAADITEAGLDFLRSQGSQTEQPFFLWLHYFDAHSPYAPDATAHALIPESRYHAEIRQVDRFIGSVLDELVELGIDGRTLVIVTSDHGEGLTEHGEATHSYFIYETTLRVPLIFSGASVPASGLRVPALVRTADIAPTILDLVGLPPLEDVDGQSLVPLMTGDASNLKLRAYGESAEATSIFGVSALRSLRRGPWKYIHKVEPELYDLTVDPGETNDLAAKHAELVAELRAELEELLRSQSVEMTSPIEIDAEVHAQLQSLGYASGEIDAQQREVLDEFEPAGTDHTTLYADFRLYIRAISAERTQDLEVAIALFEELYERTPSSHRVYDHLLFDYQQTGQIEKAIFLARRMASSNPDVPDYSAEIANLLIRQREYAEAEELLAQVAESDECNERLLELFPSVLLATGRHAEMMAFYEKGMSDCGPDTDFQNDYAYALATSPTTDLRNGRRALRIARRIVADGGQENPAYVDTLAAAYAEVGDFDQAVVAAKRAVALVAISETRERILAHYRGHLETLQSGQPIRTGE